MQNPKHDGNMESFQSLTKSQREAVGLLSVGTFLEYFDLLLYVHMAVFLNELFFPKTDPFTASLLAAFSFCTTYLLRPFGALVFGWIGDRVGRKSVVIITTFMMAISCFTMSILPTYAQIGIAASWGITICRIMQGMSSMGELIGAQVYLTEITKPPVRYPLVSLTAVFSVLGGTFALMVASLATIPGTSFNWRWAFGFGVVVALIGTVARTTLKETPDFANAKKRTQTLLNKTNTNVDDQPVWENDRKKDLKTLRYKFFLDCGWPVCFYISYIFFGNILKQDYGFSSSEVIRQNLIVSVMQFFGILSLSILSYRINPIKIVKVKLFIFIIMALVSPFLINIFHSSYVILFIQCSFIVFSCDCIPAMPITFKAISVLRRFTYSSMSYALSRTIMSIITSFGLVYLFKYFGHWGIFFILVPLTTGSYLAISYFEGIEKEAGTYH